MNKLQKLTSQKPVTIKSIAAELGISFSTVAKALNNNPHIKEETRIKVQKKAKEMGYTPNSLAKSLRSNESHTLAVILNDIENPVLTHIFKSISDEMAKYGYTTLILDSYFDIKTERKNITVTLAQKPNFVIWEPASIHLENLDLFATMPSNLVLLGPHFDVVNVHQVSVDYENGGYETAINLLSNGHRDNLVLTTPLTVPNSFDFVKGIKRAYSEFGYTLEEDRILTSVNSSVTGGFVQINKLWDYESKSFTIPFTGIMSFDDNVAFGVYKAAKQFNLSIPEDISISSFDDNPLTAFSSPAFDTVHLPREEIASNCISIIKSVLLQNDQSIHAFYTKPYLVKRESVFNLFTTD